MIDYSTAPHAAVMTPEVVNYYERRVELFLKPAAERLRGARVLDLACNDGRLSWPMLEFGASSIVGVEARNELVDRANDLMAAECEAGRAKFIQADLFEFLAGAQPGEYDAILCAGFLYHTVRQVDFFREMKRLAPETLIIDTSVAKNYWWYGRKNFGKPPGLFLYSEDAALSRNTMDLDGVVFWPTVSFIETMARVAGYEPKRQRIPKGADGRWNALGVHKKGIRAAWVCEKKL